MSIQVSPETQSPPQSKAAAERQAYLKGLLEHSARADRGNWLDELRDRTSSLVHEQTFPSTRDEEWKFTDLSAMLDTEFRPAPAPGSVDAQQVNAYALTEASVRLVFVDGRYTPEMSAIAELPDGVVVGNLEALEADKLATYLGQQKGGNEVFTALNAAGFQDAAVVWIPRNQSVAAPLHLLFISTAKAEQLTQPRVLVVAESSSAVTLVEDYIGFGDAVQFTNAVTEIWLDENAQVNHTRVQRETNRTVHIGKTAVSQARDSRYALNAIAVGGQISRHNIDIFQTGPQTATHLYGLSLLTDKQVADTHSAIHYAQPHGTAEQIQKNIVDGQAHAVFNGKIFVPRAAQMTNASQENRNLLLSDKARVDTKPQLEIVADNVKCAHGATVSQLEADEVFYLQSRGISQDNAQRLLIFAFAQDVINRIPVAELRQTLTQYVTEQTR